MEALARDLGIVGGLLLVVHLCGGWRHRWSLALLAAIGAVAAGAVLAFLHPATAGIGWQPALAVELLLWLAVGVAARHSSRGAIYEDTLLPAAVLGGLGLGAAPTALLLGPVAGRQAHRVAVAAAAAALLSPIGGPVTLALGPLAWRWWPLIALLVAVAAPPGARPKAALAPLVLLAGLATLSGVAAQLLALGWLLRGSRARPRWPWRSALVLAAALVMAWTARHAGLADGAAEGGAWLLGELGGPTMSAVAVLASLLGALGGGLLTAPLWAEAIADAPREVVEAVILGLGLGSLVPLRLSGMLEGGRRLWLLVLVVGLVGHGLSWR